MDHIALYDALPACNCACGYLMTRYHVIGGGLSGLSAAVTLKSQGHDVYIYEAAKYFGGRCRSYFDPHLKIKVDNGNHLILGCNDAVFDYLKKIDATDLLQPLNTPIKMNNHQTQKNISPPFLTLFKFLCAHISTVQTAGDYFNQSSKSWQDFFVPLIVSIQNTNPSDAALKQLQNCLRKIFFNLNLKARTAYQAVDDLSQTLIDPALEFLGQSRCHSLHKLLGVEQKNMQITGLVFQNKRIEVGANDRVIFALSLPIINDLFKLNLEVQEICNPISNLHFKIEHGLKVPQILGLVNAQAHWIFIKKDHISVTISDCHMKASDKQEKIAEIWSEIRAYFPILPEALPAYKLIVEKYATLKQTPSILQQIQKLELPNFANASFVGDWRYAHYPNTIEAALKAGSHLR